MLTALTLLALVPAVAACDKDEPSGRGEATGRADEAHTDVLFIGAHPDDEFQSLATFGRWKEKDGLTTGVVTITRGEGGGNAAGPEEGAALGMIREREEREAVGVLGIRNVFYLDKPDFWYTLSAPLTARSWNRAPQRPTDTLERLVRLIRATTPKTVVTMDPRPFHQHGAHQQAGRLATEAFTLAGDPDAFPGQLTGEKYRPWKPSRLLTQNWGFEGPLGQRCDGKRADDEHTGLPVLGVWPGGRSSGGKTWAQLERDAARKYVTQGFGSLPEKSDTPADKLPCEWFTVLAEDGKPLPGTERAQSGLRPQYAEFRDWARRVRMPWLANDAQPAYPDRPSTTVPEVAKAPVVNGRADPGEYPGPALELTHWEGTRCASGKDCAADARLARKGDDLFVLVHVTDDKKGAALDGRTDCKRHWRTDSVEVDLDPRGRSDDTSTTFKAAVLPFTAKDGGACAERDGDNRQGPAASTAPGMTVASTVTEPYEGYTVEMRIPLAGLPAPVDPGRLTANVLLYDSDTQDRTGQSRLAWSTFGSAQADPYVWGTLELPGHVPPSGRPTRPADLPLEAAKSEDSAASRAQSRRTGVPLAGGPRRPE
ncbi:sugar-binding protein [Streptomyces sp. I05A-00742]|uniref:sugar-binding protein n=1 Tax=Streptomyces sp. I05A-00742 TaxID=2732853 RepID=UPI001488F5BE|nr:sugar-binding protein [Streptomyces sp. I05A-00742]